MASQWIIDAYNFIRQSPYFSSLEASQPEQAKNEVLQYLNEFSQLTQEKLVLVFDAYSGTHSQPIQSVKGQIKVIESRGSYTADEEIILLAQSLKEAAIVISSDREVICGAVKAGASVLSSSEFERELNKVFRAAEDPDFYPRQGSGKFPKEKKKAYRLIRKYQDPQFYMR